MEEAEAAKAEQRAEAELPKLEPTEAKESVAEVYLQQVSAEQQTNKRRRGEAGSPEEVSADAKEIPTQVPGAQVPEEGRRQRRKKN